MLAPPPDLVQDYLAPGGGIAIMIGWLVRVIRREWRALEGGRVAPEGMETLLERTRRIESLVDGIDNFLRDEMVREEDDARRHTEVLSMVQAERELYISGLNKLREQRERDSAA